MFLGIEIGGTKLQLGIGPGDGTLLGFWRGTVDVAAGGEGIRQQILAAVPKLLTGANLKRDSLQGIGVGFGGPVDDATRSVIKSHQIAGWDGFPLADWLGKALGLPAVLGNDADVAGLAEALFGAGRGLSPVFYITVGSGIGGGLIVNGEIMRGVGHGAAEIGHLRVFDPRREIGELRTLEEIASGWAIGKEARVQAITQPDRCRKMIELAGALNRITAQTVADAAKEGDEFADLILCHALDALADAICAAIVFVCPRRVVIGGGVSLIGEELFFDRLRRRIARLVFEPFRGLTDVMPATLGEAVVVHGRWPWHTGGLAGKLSGESSEPTRMTTATATMPKARLLTADEFYDWCNRPENVDRFFELVRGQVIEVPPPMKIHGVVAANTAGVLWMYSRQRRRGYITTNDSGVVLEHDPDTVRGPDVAYFTDAKSFSELHPRYGENPPVLAVEILSPDDRVSKVLRKIDDYLKNGVKLVWLVDPDERTVRVFRPNQSPLTLAADQVLPGDEELPGFHCLVNELFVLPEDLASPNEPANAPTSN